MVFGILVFASVALNLYVILGTRSSVFEQIENLPPNDFALVLGTEPVRPDGSTNLHFISRTESAAKIYLAGKASHLLISGNKNNRGFNEVEEMKNRILTKNVPDSALELDFSGSRTFDSVRSAREIYRLQKLTIVTDRFHAPRALFLCRHFGIAAVAFCPPKEPFSFWSVRYSVREYFARLKAFADVVTNP